MRFKLSVWYSSLLLVFGIAFVIALNVAARVDHPNNYEISGVRWEAVREGPGRAMNGDPSVTVTVKYFEDQIYADNIQRLQTWSLVAIVGLALASGVGGYLFSGMMLRPVRDITEAASEISASNLSRRINHLGPDDELKALADTFDSMIGRLEVSFEQQRQFVQDASHELRTPLAAIRTNIEVTEMDEDATKEEYRGLVEMIKGQTERLARLSDDLLLLSVNERDAPAPEPVEVSRLVREVFRELDSVAGLKGVELLTEGDPALEAQAAPDLLYRAVLNLVDNAIKYSGEGATVTVRSRRDGASAVIAVADNGPGIAPGDLERVFDRFYRVDRGRSRRDGGTGLGLAIVRELVQSMGGTVGVESAPGVGTTFTVRLPAAEEPAAEVHRQAFGGPRVGAVTPS
ncbi:MAG: HAMP domain-containing histidine kinase [Chloroflexi bacterium]|nr:HAMP domain-containing histidine kinase [Chloroflexota bacterium]